MFIIKGALRTINCLCNPLYLEQLRKILMQSGRDKICDMAIYAAT